MNKLIISLITLILLTCNANSKKQIEFTTKKLDLPLKILFGKKDTDSTFVYLCFPTRIVYFNKSSTPIKVSRYNINVNQVGTNSKDYRWYKYSDSLIYPKSFKIEPFKTDSIDFYYGYSIKLSNLKLDSLIDNKTVVQKYRNLKIYNIPVNKNLKKWAISKIKDSIKGKIHFKLHNKEKGFFYKSLDIELFED